METQVTIHMASKYAVDTRKLDGETVTFLSKSFGCARKVYNLYVDTYYQGLEQAGYQNGDGIPKVALPEVSSFKNQAGLSYLKKVDSLALANVKQQFEASVKRFREQANHKAYTKRALRRSESGTEPLCMELRHALQPAEGEGFRARFPPAQGTFIISRVGCLVPGPFY